MFDSLKSKLKGIFKKAPAEIADVPTEEPSSVPVEEKREETTPSVPPTEVPQPTKKDEEPIVKASKPVVEQAPPKTLSRKEQMKLEKESKKKGVVDEMLTDSLLGKKIKDESLDDFLWELEIALLEADVALPVVEEIKEGVRENLIGKKFTRDHTLEEIVELSIKDAVRNVLKLNEFDFDAWFKEQERPTSIMFVGINGTGKTTAIAKIANRKGCKCIIYIMIARNMKLHLAARA